MLRSDGLHRYGSSLRIMSLEESLKHGRRIARDVGITRVTDTTRLDRVGVPVFASIRPAAARGSLCVSAGKGLRREEAEVGAYMEGIELAFAEAERTSARIFPGTPRDVLDGKTRPDAICDFAPWRGRGIALDGPLDCVEASDVRTGERVVVPAELAVYPYAKPIHGGHLYFGSDGNGICSGNSVDEATVHGITEVIERDVTSFINVKDTSILVYGNAIAPQLSRTTTSVGGSSLRDTLPPAIAALVSDLDTRGFDVWMRYLPNEFAMPAFMAVVRERGVLEGIHFGYGCHISSSIALVRAVTEALQCRLTAIHGGRDDLFRVFEPRSRMSTSDKLAYLERNAIAAASEDRGVINFDEIPDYSKVISEIDDALTLLLDRLAASGIDRVLRVVLGPADLPIQIVRVLVPKLEIYAHGIQRMGHRLSTYMRDVAGGRPERSASERAR